MPIAVTCACGKKYRAPDELAGKTLRCPACGGEIAVMAPNLAQPSTAPAWAQTPPTQSPGFQAPPGGQPAAYPQQSFPPQAYPQQAYPQQPFPQSGFSPPGFAQPGAPPMQSPGAFPGPDPFAQLGGSVAPMSFPGGASGFGMPGGMNMPPPGMGMPMPAAMAYGGKKKGTPVWLWIVIGVVGVLVLGGIGVGVAIALSNSGAPSNVAVIPENVPPPPGVGGGNGGTGAVPPVQDGVAFTAPTPIEIQGYQVIIDPGFVEMNMPQGPEAGGLELKKRVFLNQRQSPVVGPGISLQIFVIRTDRRTGIPEIEEAHAGLRVGMSGLISRGARWEAFQPKVTLPFPVIAERIDGQVGDVPLEIRFYSTYHGNDIVIFVMSSPSDLTTQLETMETMLTSLRFPK